jgi:hypothetical protein
VSGKKQPRRNGGGRQPGNDKKAQVIAAILGGSGTVLAATIAAVSSHLGKTAPAPSDTPASSALPAVSAPASMTPAASAASETPGTQSSNCARGGDLASGKGSTDTRTLSGWRTIYWCPTGGNAVVYVNADRRQPFDKMDGTHRLWVVCQVRRAGEIWYYTQGNFPLSGAPAADNSLHGWGFITADALDVRDRPDPAVPACPSSVPAG